MSTAVAIESPLEAAHAVLLPCIAPNKEPRVRTAAAKCIGLMAGYHERWKDAPYRIEDVEVFVSSDLYNPKTEAKSRTFTVAGKLDVIATEMGTGRRVIFDHKTTSDDITDPNGPYWRQLVVEGQPTHYLLLEWLNGRKADYAMWDVVRKPSIRPSKLSKKEREAVTFQRSYCGHQLSDEEMDEFGASEQETPIMYAARLMEDCTQIRPQWYFQRRQLPRLDTEILEYAGELWDHSQDLILSRRYNRHPRNSGACMLYGSPCKFLGLCSGHDSLDGGNWATRACVHPELGASIQGDGKEILTNSRIRCFQTCRRKHQLQYEIGIERIEEEEREALFFGTMLHQAMEAYFIALKSQQEQS